MPMADTVRPDLKFFGMFAGRSSSGKSVAEYSFPKGMRVLDSDLRKGYLGVKDWLPIENISILPLAPRSSSFGNYLKELESLESQFKANQRPYETILVDALGSMCRIFMDDARKLIGGQKKGELRLSGPADFKYITQACYDIFDFLKTLPCNVIVSAHIQNKWGKPPSTEDSDNDYADNIIVGTELAGVSQNLGESILGYFDELYVFSKNEDGTKHYVEFQSDLARSVYKLPRGKQDITRKPFYPFWLNLVKNQYPEVPKK